MTIPPSPENVAARIAADKNTRNEERKMAPGSGKETAHCFSVMRFFKSLLGTRKWSCAKSQVCRCAE